MCHGNVKTDLKAFANYIASKLGVGSLLPERRLAEVERRSAVVRAGVQGMPQRDDLD